MHTMSGSFQGGGTHSPMHRISLAVGKSEVEGGIRLELWVGENQSYSLSQLVVLSVHLLKL